MAFNLKLALHRMSLSNLNGVDTLSLAAFANGFDVEDRSWAQAASAGADGYVTESMVLHANDATQDALAANLSALSDKVRQSREQYGSGDELYTFLQSQATYESRIRQAHIRRIDIGKMAYTIGDVFDKDIRIMNVPIAIERAPWEPDSPASQIASTVSKLGGASTFSPIVSGDVPARLQRFRLSTASTIECWVGFRGTRYGVPGNYIPVYGWSAEGFNSGGSYGTDTTSAADATAYGGNRLQCSFATVDTMALRAHTNLNQLDPTNFDDYAGTHLILLRAKCSDGSTVCRVRLATGSAYSFTQHSLAAHEPVKVNTTNWTLFPLGILDTSLYTGAIPLYGNLVGFGIQAERVSGSGSLHFDVIGLVPYGEGFVYARVPSGTLVDSAFTPTGLRTVYNNVAMGTGYSQVIPLSPGVTRQMYFAQGASGVALADTETQVEVVYYPRWLTLRGNEL